MISIRLLGAALATAAVLTPHPASAQRARYATVSLSTTQSYESNLFADERTREPESDLVSMIGPLFEAGYVSQPLQLTARYGLDAARYHDHAALSRALARQEAAVEVQHRPTRRLNLDLRTSYLRTQSPYELNLDSGLNTGHALAERRLALSAATYEWTPLTRMRLEYGVTLTALQGAPDGQAQEARVGVERQSAERGGRRIEYRVLRFSFDGSRPETSHVVAAGWSRNLTRRTSVELSGGPRLSAGSVHAEISATLRRQFQKGDLSAGYASTQATAVGETGLIDVQRMSVSIAYRPTRHVAITAAPTAAVSSLGGSRASVYMLNVEAIGQARRDLVIVVSGRAGVQYGTLEGAHDVIPYRTLSVGLRATFPRSSRTGRPGGTS